MNTWDTHSLRSEMKKWVESPSNEKNMRDSARQRIEDHFAKLPDPRAAGQVSVGLLKLGQWEGCVGALAVLDGRPAGWSSLSRCLDWRLLEIGLLRLLYLEDSRKRKQPRAHPVKAALGACHAMALGRLDCSRWCVDQLASGHEDGSIGPWGNSPFESFPLNLYALFSELRSIPTFGVFAEVISAWDDPTRLKSAIEAVCDYHVHHIGDPNDSEPIVEFESWPYPVFPVEVLAVERVRTIHDFDFPTVDHPIMRSPLAMVPKDIDLDEDPLLTRVFEAMREAYPGFELPDL